MSILLAVIHFYNVTAWKITSKMPTKFWESFGLMLIHPTILLTWRLALSWIYEICGFTSSRIRELESPEVWSRGFMIRCILDTTEAFRAAAVVKSVYETRGSIIKLIHLKNSNLYVVINWQFVQFTLLEASIEPKLVTNL